ncbi:hypothetical protein RRG08_050230 [Elysia crispata]|uniref:G-protein coupled receptors family 1 profile domain-containing protein n=1 Tax=Elysia crispata TaxID=231223 RepID=A0AAE1B424_9GAST|nr:hypothetical protein RRG08_050230 [Elysia crispata]
MKNTFTSCAKASSGNSSELCSTSTSSSVAPKPDIPAWLLPILMEYISYAVVFVSVFGIPGNILILRTYAKIGFSESINISYFALGVSDFLCVIFITWNAICFMPIFVKSDIPVVATEIAIPTGGVWSVIFSEATAWITAFISFERCLCVVFPLKVKSIVTPKRTMCIIVTIFIVTTVPFASVMYFLYIIDLRFDSERNATVLGVRYRNSPTATIVHNVNQIYKLVVMTFLPYTTILICSVFLATYLNQTATWRIQNSGTNIKTTTSSLKKDSKTPNLNAKELRVAKTVLSIATAFLVLGTLGSLRLVGSIIWPQFRPLGNYDKTFRMVGRVGYLLSLTNSSVNFVIYYTMGSQFRRTVNGLFKFKSQQE